MSTNPVLMIDPTSLSELEQLLPQPPTVASSLTDDQEVTVVHYHQCPQHEVPEYQKMLHCLSIVGMNGGSNIEARLDGRICYQGWYYGGEVGVIPQGISHWVVWDRPIDLTLVFPHASLLEKVALEIVKGAHVELIPKQAAGDMTLAQLSLLLKADLEAEQSSGKLYRDSIAIALAARLLKHHAVCHVKSLSSVNKLSSQQLTILLGYIQDNLGQDVRLVDLASQINLSESHLCHLFKRSTGVSPHQYLIQQRVERAKILLQQPGKTVTEIALACGFASQSHFAKYFRQHTGMNPNQFRKC